MSYANVLVIGDNPEKLLESYYLFANNQQNMFSFKKSNDLLLPTIRKVIIKDEDENEEEQIVFTSADLVFNIDLFELKEFPFFAILSSKGWIDRDLLISDYSHIDDDEHKDNFNKVCSNILKSLSENTMISMYKYSC